MLTIGMARSRSVLIGRGEAHGISISKNINDPQQAQEAHYCQTLCTALWARRQALASRRAFDDPCRRQDGQAAMHSG